MRGGADCQVGVSFYSLCMIAVRLYQVFFVGTVARERGSWASTISNDYGTRGIYGRGLCICGFRNIVCQHVQRQILVRLECQVARTARSDVSYSGRAFYPYLAGIEHWVQLPVIYLEAETTGGLQAVAQCQ